MNNFLKHLDLSFNDIESGGKELGAALGEFLQNEGKLPSACYVDKFALKKIINYQMTAKVVTKAKFQQNSLGT